MYRWLLVGNLRLWTVQELVSSVLLCNHKSIQGETVRKVCENFQYLDMGIFVHILSGRKLMTVKDIIEILSIYKPETEVKMTSGPFISEIVDVRLVVDIDTNKTYMCIYGDKDVFTKYENMGAFYNKRTRD